MNHALIVLLREEHSIQLELLKIDQELDFTPVLDAPERRTSLTTARDMWVKKLDEVRKVAKDVPE